MAVKVNMLRSLCRGPDAAAAAAAAAASVGVGTVGACQAIDLWPMFGDYSDIMAVNGRMQTTTNRI